MRPPGCGFRRVLVETPPTPEMERQPLGELLLARPIDRAITFEELVRRTGEFLDSAPSMRPQPLISVTDVTQSSRWYQELLRCESGHGGDEYERLLRDGTLVLQLHRFDVGHHHGRIGDPSSRPYGNGVALWFEIDDFDDAVQRAEALHAQVVLPPHRNPPDGPGGPAHRELWLRDPDGYLVALASPDGESPWPDPRVG